MTAPCPGCHGTGTEPSGTTHAGLAEHLACDECGPDCPQDCGCRVDAGPERAESGVGAHPGAELSPSGYPSDPPALNGPQNRAERVSDAEAAEWERLAAGATEGPWVVDQDGSIGAPMAGLVCGEAGHPRLDCSECGTRVCHVNVMPGEPDAAFIAAARTAVPRLLAEWEALRADHAALLALHEVEVARRESAEARATRLTADLDAMEAEDNREDVRAKHWTEVLRVRRELAGVRCENNDAMEVIARGLGYPSSDFPLDRWPHLAMTGGHTPVSLAEEVVGRLDQARSLAARLEAENARLREDLSRLASEWERELTSDHRPASALEAELDPAEFRTKPNPDQPDRCPSIDPHDTLQCTRRIHEDGQCQSGGIAWVKGTPRYMSDAERANRMEGMAERLAERLVDVEERLTGERDRARGTAATLEAENARLTEALYLTRITLEATFRVLQEASGLPDDIDDPDCRDEMVLALRPRAEKAEAEVARLREGIEAMMRDVGKAQPAHVTPGIVAVRLKALLAEDEGGE